MRFGEKRMMPWEMNDILFKEQLNDVLDEIERLTPEIKKEIAELIRPYSEALYEYLIEG